MKITTLRQPMLVSPVLMAAINHALSKCSPTNKIILFDGAMDGTGIFPYVVSAVEHLPVSKTYNGLSDKRLIAVEPYNDLYHKLQSKYNTQPWIKLYNGLLQSSLSIPSLDSLNQLSGKPATFPERGVLSREYPIDVANISSYVTHGGLNLGDDIDAYCTAAINSSKYALAIMNSAWTVNYGEVNRIKSQASRIILADINTPMGLQALKDLKIDGEWKKTILDYNWAGGRGFAYFESIYA